MAWEPGWFQAIGNLNHKEAVATDATAFKWRKPFLAKSRMDFDIGVEGVTPPAVRGCAAEKSCTGLNNPECLVLGLV